MRVRADRNRRSREDVPALREPELPRVVRLLRGQLLRDAPRARVQRDPQRGGADRHLAALQVPAHRQGRDAPGRSRSSRATCAKVSVGQVVYTPWCDEHGKVIDDGTVVAAGGEHLPLDRRRPEPALVPRRTPPGLDVEIEDISERGRRARAAGPDLRPRCSRRSPRRTSTNLKYFRVTSGTIAGVPVDISRTGYTGDLGYEIWIPWNDAVKVWDALMDGGPGLRHPPRRHAGARRRAHRGRAAADRRRLPQQQEGAHRRAEILAVRDGARPSGRPRQGPVRRTGGPARGAKDAAPRARSSASSSTGTSVEALYEKLGLAPQIPATASRVAVPVYRDGAQVGKATSTTWSPTLKKLIALATVAQRHDRRRHDARDGDDGRGGAPPRAARRSSRRRSSIRRARPRRLPPSRRHADAHGSRRVKRSSTPTTRQAPLEDGLDDPVALVRRPADRRPRARRPSSAAPGRWSAALDQVAEPGQLRHRRARRRADRRRARRATARCAASSTSAATTPPRS